MELETTLYRPVGHRELELVSSLGFRGFPPRLPHQPIFYPVLTEDYAIEIARDWNTKDEVSSYVGYVLRMCVPASFVARYPIQTAGARRHSELWIPAAELPVFNHQLLRPIEVIGQYGLAGLPVLPRLIDFTEIRISGLPPSYERDARLALSDSRQPRVGETGTIVESRAEDRTGYVYTVERSGPDARPEWLADFWANEIVSAS